jgi:diacylglycerol kinase
MEDRELTNEDLATDETPIQHGKNLRMDPALIPCSVRVSSVAKANSKHHLWRDNFRRSLRGMRLGIRGHSSFFVHFFFAAFVSATAIVLRCELVEWCLLLGCIGLVLTAELFNSALETIYHGLDEDRKSSMEDRGSRIEQGVGPFVDPHSSGRRTRHGLDIAAGAVLLASITAALIGAIIFLPKLTAMLVHLLG